MQGTEQGGGTCASTPMSHSQVQGQESAEQGGRLLHTTPKRAAMGPAPEIGGFEMRKHMSEPVRHGH